MFQVFLMLLAMAIAPSGGPSGSAASDTAAVDTAASRAIAAPSFGTDEQDDAFATDEQAETGLVAEPQTPSGKFTTATEVRPILSATKASWVAVRDWDGRDLVYVTQIWSWRCGLLQLKIGINGAPPEIWPLPGCHMEMPMPSVMLPEDGLPYRDFAPGSVQTIEVEITYDDLTTDSATFQRAQVLMP